MAGRLRVAALVLALVLVGTLAACGGSDDKNVAAGAGTDATTPAADVKAPAGDPSVIGSVTKVTSGGGSVTILIPDGKDPSGTALAASVKVPSSAAVLRSSGSGFAKASPDELSDGAKVKVWFSGPVAESYPVQATAGTVVITG